MKKEFLKDSVIAMIPILLGLSLIFAFRSASREIARSADALRLEGQALLSMREKLEAAIEDLSAVEALKSNTIASSKAEITGIVTSERTLYEQGLSLQEEKRLLEKQLEIMTTYLEIDPAAKKISLMRGTQALESYTVQFATPSFFGSETKTLPPTARIVSKERFAHPERGMISTAAANGEIEWTPPQVGASVRANALGEYVMFTDSSLILHGPQKKDPEHGQFPHACIGLPRQAAQKLYRNVYIGTRIVLKSASGDPESK